MQKQNTEKSNIVQSAPKKKKKKNSGQEGIPPAQIISFLACLAQIL